MKKLLYNASIVNGDEIFCGYVIVDGDTIETVGRGLPDMAMIDSSDYESVSFRGDYLLPGVIDSHVHFRDPGLTSKGDIATESRAAVAGGVTSFMDMPNTKPQTISIKDWNDKMEHAAGCSLANYAFFIGATNDNLATLMAADYTRVPGIKLFLGSSTGNMLVDNEMTLNHLFEASPALIMVHAEDEAEIKANRADIEARYPNGDVPLSLHGTMRSSKACFKAARHAVELALRYHARLHLAHVSTSEELKLFAPGNISRKLITAETCPHYLLFSGDDMQTLGARIKCNPAIKSENDRSELHYAVNEHIIDTVATDHAPHLPADKEGDLLHAASGMPGVQFSLPVMMSLFFDPCVVVRMMCHNPAIVFRVDKRGFIAPGYKADIVRVACLREPHIVSDNDVVSRCGWTPYAGKKLMHRVVTTWVNGQPAYDDGRFAGKSSAQAIRFNPYTADDRRSLFIASHPYNPEQH